MSREVDMAKNKFYFDVVMNFESDAPVEKLESVFGLKPNKIVKLADSLGPKKTAKFIFKTEEITDFYSDVRFKSFLSSIFGNLKVAPEVMKEWKGTLDFAIVFTSVVDNPCISLDAETIKMLNALGASFQVDFI